MLQLRLAAGAALAAGLAHSAYVHSARAAAPRRPFSPASEDARTELQLKTGDLLLFRRDCTMYTCAGALVCLARQRAAAGEAGAGAGTRGVALPPFDQAAVVVSVQHVPHVLERTFSGTKLRRYDARLIGSTSPEVLLRPLAAPLAREACAALEAWALRVGGGVDGRAGEGRGAGAGGSGDADADVEGGGALAELLHALPSDARANASVALVERAYTVAGILTPPERVEEGRPRLQMRDLLPQKAGARAQGAGSGQQMTVLFARELWVRDRVG